MTVDILEGVVADIGYGEYTSDHCGELGTGDICVGSEGAVRVTGDDARLDESADLFVEPHVGFDIT